MGSRRYDAAVTSRSDLRSPAGGTPLVRRLARLSLFAVAAIGGLLGFAMLMVQIEVGALRDVRAYYDAATRLNEGLPLYPAGADPDAADFYRYPPLLAILFRPFAKLPFETVAAMWQGVVVASLVGTIWRIGPRRRSTWIAVGLLSFPIAFCSGSRKRRCR